MHACARKSKIASHFFAYLLNLRGGGAFQTYTVICNTLMVKLSGLTGRAIGHLSSFGITASNDTAITMYKTQAMRRLRELRELCEDALAAHPEKRAIVLAIFDNFNMLGCKMKMHIGDSCGQNAPSITNIATQLEEPSGGLNFNPNRPPAFPEPTRALVEGLLPIFVEAVESDRGFGVGACITTTRRNVGGSVRLKSFDAFPPAKGSSASESNLIEQMFVLFLEGHLGERGRDKFLSVDPEPARVMMNLAAKSHVDVKNFALVLSAFHNLLWSMKLAISQPPLVLMVLGSIIRLTQFRVLTYRKVEVDILKKLESNRPGDVDGLLAGFAADLFMGQEGPLPADDEEEGEEQVQHAPGLQVDGMSDARVQLCVRTAKAIAVYAVAHKNATVLASTSTKLKETANAAAQDEFKHGRGTTELYMNSKTSKHIFDGMVAGAALARDEIEELLRGKPWSLGTVWFDMLNDEILSTIKPYKHMVEEGEIADLYDALPRTMLLWISYGGHPRLIQSCMSYVISISHLVAHRPDLINALAENGKALTEAFIEHLHSVLKGLVDNLGGLATHKKISLCTVLHKDLHDLHSTLKKVYGRYSEDKPNLDADVLDRADAQTGMRKKKPKLAAVPKGRESETCQQSMDWEPNGVYSKDAEAIAARFLSDAKMWAKFDNDELLRQGVSANEIAALMARSPLKDGLAILPQFLKKISDDLESIVAEDTKLKIDATMSPLLFWLNLQMGSTLDELLVRLRATRANNKDLMVAFCGTTMATKIVAIEGYMIRTFATPAASVTELERLCQPAVFGGKMREGVAFKVQNFQAELANQNDAHSRFQRARAAVPRMLEEIYAEKYNDLDPPRQKNK